MTDTNRRRFLTATGGLVAGGIASTGTAAARRGQARLKRTGDEHTDGDYEVWAVDQGTDTVHIYRPETPGADDTAFTETDTVDIGWGTEAEANTPHMVYYSSDDSYVAIASTGAKGAEDYEDLTGESVSEEEVPGSSTVVLDAESREVVTRLETGPGSHFASFSPDDEYLLIDVIGESAIKRIPFEGVETPTDESEWDVLEVPGGLSTIENEDAAPVCHEYTGEGHSYHTLGPSYHNGALVRLDWEAFEVADEFTHEEIPANCGTIPDPERDQFFLTAGLPTPTDEDGDVEDAAGGVGEWYVFDTESHRPIDRDGRVIPEDESFTAEEIARSARGIDAHGVHLTEGRGSPEFWVVNRETNDGVVIRAEDLCETDRLEAIGPAEASSDEHAGERGDLTARQDPAVTGDRDAPDILWASPDDRFMFATLRGPAPLSGDPHASTGINAGIAVWDVEARERVTVLEPAAEEERSDFHGIGVREL